MVDKDATGALMARELEADGFIILTDGGGIWHNFGKPDGREMKAVTPKYLKARKTGQKFPGSMGPKISAISFVEGSVQSKRLGHHRRFERRRRADEWCEGHEGVPRRARDVPDDVTWHTVRRLDRRRRPRSVGFR